MIDKKECKMLYRTLPHGGEKISIIGLGMGSIHDSSDEEIEKIIVSGMNNGINYFDMAASEGRPYKSYAKAFENHRKDIILQMHFGAVYDNGQYGWTRDLKKIKDTFQSQLKLLNTDYTDMGFVHCIDEMNDFDEIMSRGIWDYMKDLKKDGVIRHLGLSSHDPQIVRKFLDTGLIDMVMFSINPAYDYSTGDYGIGSISDRVTLYHECEKNGVGISVMKPFGGGKLLDAKTSPFKHKLTHYQCIQYALDRPAVMTVLPGIRSMEDLDRILGFMHADETQKDYSIISEFTPQNADGICVYCNHCQPCPQEINIGLINKYYDLALAGDVMAKGHYDKLQIKADSCIKCGHCESRCPFHVKQETRMEEIMIYFNNNLKSV